MLRLLGMMMACINVSVLVDIIIVVTGTIIIIVVIITKKLFN